MKVDRYSQFGLTEKLIWQHQKIKAICIAASTETDVPIISQITWLSYRKVNLKLEKLAKNVRLILSILQVQGPTSYRNQN